MFNYNNVILIGSVTTIVGSSQSGKVDGVGSSAQFSFPDGIEIDCMGNLFVSDRGNHRIRKVSEKGLWKVLKVLVKFDWAINSKILI